MEVKRTYKTNKINLFEDIVEIEELDGDMEIHQELSESNENNALLNSIKAYEDMLDAELTMGTQFLENIPRKTIIEFFEKLTQYHS